MEKDLIEWMQGQVDVYHTITLEYVSGMYIARRVTDNEDYVGFGRGATLAEAIAGMKEVK